MILTNGSELAPIPETLATWLQERSFNICPWFAAPRTTRKILGKDAWGFANIVLTRIPIGTAELRYYVAICPKPHSGTAVGYWLEVRQLSNRGATA